MRVSVIGLGSMGLGMATSLVRAGIDTTGFDLVPANLERLRAAGGHGASTAEEAARGADVLVVVVVNAEQVEAALFSGDAVREASTDAVIVACATVAPDRTREIAKKVEATGRAFVDAPISGGSVKAAEGALTMLISGKRAAKDRVQTVLNTMASKIYDLGEEAGTGSAFKLVNQLLAGVHIVAACEAIVFAKRLGLDMHAVYDVIKGSAGNSWMFENRIPHVLDNDYAPRSAVDIFTKDLGIVSDVSRAMKFGSPMASTALQLFLMTAAAGMDKDDDASVARLYAMVAREHLSSVNT